MVMTVSATLLNSGRSCVLTGAVATKTPIKKIAGAVLRIVLMQFISTIVTQIFKSLGLTPQAFANCSPGLRALARYPGKIRADECNPERVAEAVVRLISISDCNWRTLSEFVRVLWSRCPRALPWAGIRERLRR